MKYYRQISYTLGVIFLFTVGILTFQIYESGIERRGIYKQKAETSLKSAVELWVNDEFEKPIHALLLSSPSVDSLNEMWQSEIKNIHSDCAGGLILHSELPGVKKEKKFIAGDSTLIIDKYKLGDYYLDDMYFLELAAYLSLPSPWLCIDWKENGIMSCLTIITFGLYILFFFGHQKMNNNDANNYEKADNPNNFVLYLSEKKHQIGKVIFDEATSTLTFEDQSIKKCPMQTYKLLSAFIHAENHFLSNNQIIKICGWNPEDIGINERRRMAISQLRKLLEYKKSYVKIESGKNEQKELGFYMLL